MSQQISDAACGRLDFLLAIVSLFFTRRATEDLVRIGIGVVECEWERKALSQSVCSKMTRLQQFQRGMTSHRSNRRKRSYKRVRGCSPLYGGNFPLLSCSASEGSSQGPLRSCALVIWASYSGACLFRSSVALRVVACHVTAAT